MCTIIQETGWLVLNAGNSLIYRFNILSRSSALVVHGVFKLLAGILKPLILSILPLLCPWEQRGQDTEKPICCYYAFWGWFLTDLPRGQHLLCTVDLYSVGAPTRPVQWGKDCRGKLKKDQRQGW